MGNDCILYGYGYKISDLCLYFGDSFQLVRSFWDYFFERCQSPCLVVGIGTDFSIMVGSWDWNILCTLGLLVDSSSCCRRSYLISRWVLLVSETIDDAFHGGDGYLGSTRYCAFRRVGTILGLAFFCDLS